MLNSFWKYNIIWIFWLCLITYLSNAPSNEIPSISILNFEGIDKIIHAVFYFILMLSMTWGFRKQHFSLMLKNKSLLFPFIFCMFWGALMELMQMLVFTYRSAELMDMLANTFGASLGLLLIAITWNSNKIA